MGQIRIIGPRGSGKTTYLAALAYLPKTVAAKVTKYTIQPINDNTKLLAEKAESIIREGSSLEPTTIIGGIDSQPVYSFTIEIKTLFSNNEIINLAVRDYPGEVFEELEAGVINPLHTEFIDECFRKDVVGCLLLLTEWNRQTDKFYSRVVEQLANLMETHERINDLRVAVVMSKCERGELWPGRLDPEIDLFEVHLRETKEMLKAKIPSANLQFFAISTFGILRRNDPRPNRIDELGRKGRLSVLRDSDHWRPYGMISPLYWLNTGKRMRYDA